ncbi:transcription factor Tfb2 family protein [Mitosporidium daphniae]|uniref:RNA polymerase II transcription factor B subunit 2 n=1 Tax=Mitosporidium daphniae TaxID=1485682 RepID=A0A098VVR0_9MICR|nr:transcription factor Tfb2 family protein [Mitosporidium daphniae]KGG52924.1 transcription factor Tfb2 family protein [Mitosporidium daphniae]|eukprot:XP_013239360.1 transcription factor Tfb2 family protein [Mitosporidium daphniae]
MEQLKEFWLLIALLAWTEPFLGGQVDRFYITPFCRLLFDKESCPEHEPRPFGDNFHSPSASGGFLIIETNYRVYAMTNSSLHISILSLFVTLKNHFPGMATGVLSRESLQSAFERGLTSTQILSFFRSVAHPSQIKVAIENNWPTPVPPTIEDQLNLWEQERYRLVATPAVLYTGFNTSLEYEQFVSKAESLNSLLACSYPLDKDTPKSNFASLQRKLMVISEEGHQKLRQGLAR